MTSLREQEREARRLRNKQEAEAKAALLPKPKAKEPPAFKQDAKLTLVPNQPGDAAAAMPTHVYWQPTVPPKPLLRSNPPEEDDCNPDRQRIIRHKGRRAYRRLRAKARDYVRHAERPATVGRKAVQRLVRAHWRLALPEVA